MSRKITSTFPFLSWKFNVIIRDTCILINVLSAEREYTLLTARNCYLLMIPRKNAIVALFVTYPQMRGGWSGSRLNAVSSLEEPCKQKSYLWECSFNGDGIAFLYLRAPIIWVPGRIVGFCLCLSVLVIYPSSDFLVHGAWLLLMA